MANFTPSKKTTQDFNNGVEYVDGYGDETGDVVHAETINNVIESQLWTQAIATNPVDNSEADNVGKAEIEIALMPDGTPRVKAKNLKGKTGSQGDTGASIEEIEVIVDGETFPDISNSEVSAKIIGLIYPIGSIYMSVNDTSPQILFGGTWERIEGRFLLGSSASYVNGSSGGSADAVVVEHGGHIGSESSFGDAGESTYYLDVTQGNLYSTDRPYVVRAGNELVMRGTPRGESGKGKNMPPYLVVNIWKRID